MFAMYVCVCNAYSDADIRHAAQSGARRVRDAYGALGRGPRCGRCLAFAQFLIDRVHGGGEAGARFPPRPERPAVQGARQAS